MLDNLHQLVSGSSLSRDQWNVPTLDGTRTHNHSQHSIGPIHHENPCFSVDAAGARGSRHCPAVR
jgi:hypothetical protein